MCFIFADHLQNNMIIYKQSIFQYRNKIFTFTFCFLCISLTILFSILHSRFVFYCPSFKLYFFLFLFRYISLTHFVSFLLFSFLIYLQLCAMSLQTDRDHGPPEPQFFFFLLFCFIIELFRHSHVPICSFINYVMKIVLLFSDALAFDYHMNI